MYYCLKKINVVILCGGFGKRLRSVVSDRPKVLAKINDKTFLDIVIDNLLSFGFRKIILSIGYQKEKIKDHFADRANQKHCTLLFSEEETPLGTGGALKKTEALIRSDTFLVMNGDSFCNIDFDKLLNFHKNKKANITMVLVQANEAGDYATIKLDNSFRVRDYKEKVSSSENKIVSAGVYLMQKEIFNNMPDKDVFSLEYDFFPKMMNREIYGYVVGDKFFDIGTPERYREANRHIPINREIN